MTFVTHDSPTDSLRTLMTHDYDLLLMTHDS